MKRDNISIDVFLTSATILLVAIIILVVEVTIHIIKGSPKSVEPNPTYIDTTKVHVLYEDTWGKILFIKEEDL